MERYTETDKSRLLNVKARCGETTVPKTLIFVDAAGDPFDITAKDWELLIKKMPGATGNVFRLIEGSGLTITDTNKLTFELDDDRSVPRADVFFWVLRSQSEDHTWLNGDWEFHNGKYDGVTEVDTITISEDGGTVLITVTGGSGGGTSIQFQEEGVNLGDNQADTVDFVGGGVTATRVADKIIVTIPGSSTEGIQSVQSGIGINIDDTDPDNPIVSVDDTHFGSAAFAETTDFDAAGAASTVQGNLNTHASNTSNPHGVTKSQVGLSNVDNTSDASKPVSTLQAAADAAVLSSAQSYADGLVVNLWDDRGSFSAAGGAYPSSGGSGSAGAILRGDVWTISVAGTLPTGQVVEIGDLVRALVNTPGNTQANWAITQNNIGYTAENITNKSNTTTLGTSTTLYPTQNAVKVYADAKVQNNLTASTTVAPSATAVNTGLALKEDLTNKSTSVVTDQASNTKYPSVKSVYDWVIGLGYQVALTAANFGAFIVGLTDKATPVDADTIPISDSAASNATKKLTWANVKATLKTYFDTLYDSKRTILFVNTLSTNNNAVANTLQDATDYVIPLLANNIYLIDVFILYTTAATGTGMRIAPNYSAAFDYLVGSTDVSLTTASRAGNTVNANDTPGSASLSSIAGTNVAMMTIKIRPTANGNLQIKFASELSSSAVNIIAGGHIQSRIIG